MSASADCALPDDPVLETVVAVVVTRDRPRLLQECLDAVLRQAYPIDEVIVVDNASGPDTASVLRDYPTVRCIRFAENQGGAGGYRAGLQAGLTTGAAWLWVMDDDGRPATPECLERLLEAGRMHGAALVGALVVDVDAPERLAFPIRLCGRTVFETAEVERHGPVRGFAHLFNGALIRGALLRRIGLPDARFFIRGDEVEFLYRARRSGMPVVLEPRAVFLHPGSAREIHPILGGRYYAVVPTDAVKQFHQFRNRGYIFRQYGMWGWIAADVVRYGAYYLVSRRPDVRGFWRWGAATWCGIVGRFMHDSIESDE